MTSKKQGDKQEKAVKKKTTKRKAPKAKLFVPEKDDDTLAQEEKWETKKGRPPIFNPDLAIQLMETEIERYLNGRMPTYEEIEIGQGEKTQAKIKSVSFPMLGDIALKCGVTTETLTLIAHERNEDGSLKNKQLFDTTKTFKEMSLLVMLKGGLTGDYNPKIVEFLANVNHAMIPQTKVEQAVEVKSMTAVYEALDELHNKELQRVETQRAEMAKRQAILNEIDDE